MKKFDKKVSHYNDKPWNKKAPRANSVKKAIAQKEKAIQATDNPYELLKMDFESKYMYASHWINKFDVHKEPETLDIFLARSLPERTLYRKDKTQWVEGQGYAISKKTILKAVPMNGHWKSFFIEMPSFNLDYFIASLWQSTNPELRNAQIRKRLKAFMDEPIPEPPPSLLILPKEVEAGRLKDAQTEAIAGFIIGEVEKALEPKDKRIDQLSDNISTQADKITEQHELIELLKDQLQQAESKIASLREWRGRIARASTDTENARHIRVED